MALAVTMLLIGFQTSVYAGNWVLWAMYKDTHGALSPENTWVINQSFPSTKECNEGIKETMTMLESEWEKALKEKPEGEKATIETQYMGQGAFFIVTSVNDIRKRVLELHLRCHPQGVDPNVTK
jgi:hypothetical protein